MMIRDSQLMDAACRCWRSSFSSSSSSCGQIDSSVIGSISCHTFVLEHNRLHESDFQDFRLFSMLLQLVTNKQSIYLSIWRASSGMVDVADIALQDFRRPCGTNWRKMIWTPGGFCLQLRWRLTAAACYHRIQSWTFSVVKVRASGCVCPSAVSLPIPLSVSLSACRLNRVVSNRLILTSFFSLMLFVSQRAQ